jgi:hypothetical protein
VISKQDIQDWSRFLWQIAEKLANNIEPKLEKLLSQKQIEVDEERGTAIAGLNIS